jgi:2-oxo-4-hydroxy-4-carboxy-5-ureidoimidazoline decarboxylase
MIAVNEIDRLSTEDFVSCLGGIYEHSPWVAERALVERPFVNRERLVAGLKAVVEAASEAEKLALIRAHPDLAGKLARGGSLTAESTREQAGLGLDRLSDAEYDHFSTLNERYRERFGFPFIICARLTTRDGVLAAFETRLENDVQAEIAEALIQIHHIARLRLEDKIA